MRIVTPQRIHRVALFVPLLMLLSILACKKAPPIVEKNYPEDFGKPAALLSLARGPLFFEFADEGLRLISSFATSYLEPMRPWPNSRISIAVMEYNKYIVVVVNRWGYLLFLPDGEGRLLLYKDERTEAWKDYSIAGVLQYEDDLGALLYRDRFFETSDALDLSPPLPRLSWLRQTDRLEPLAFSAVPIAASWDISDLAYADASWLFRAQRLEQGRLKDTYMQAASLDAQPREIGVGAFRDARMPLSLQSYDGIGAEALHLAAKALDSTEALLVQQGRSASSESAVLLYPEPKQSIQEVLGSESIAVQNAWLASIETTEGYRYCLLQEDGTLRNIEVDGTVRNTKAPPLDPGFVYTGFGWQEGICIATWEEQDSWASGAAGIVVFSSL